MDRWMQKYQDKKIVLLGFGREGQSTYNFFKKYVKACKIQIMDQNVAYVEGIIGAGSAEVKVYSQENYLKFDKDVDLVFKSPGIPLKQLEGTIDLTLITSQSNEFIEHYRTHIIGITGTKGKSTTASFVYELLRNAGVSVELVGNIGKPAFDYIVLGQEIPTYIYELSSHQLETVQFSPSIAVVLNIFEEHLDHYHSFEAYAQAKMNIGRFQEKDDILIYSELDNTIKSRMKGFKGQTYPMKQGSERLLCDEILETIGHGGICIDETKVTVKYGSKVIKLAVDISRRLEGKHNLVNMAIGLLLYWVSGHEDYEVFDNLLHEFEGLPHRLARVARVNGITYYNDSISTIPQAAIAAMEAVLDTDSIILGGMDRGINYGPLIAYMNAHKSIKCILLPDTGHKLYELIENAERLYRVESMIEAVGIASQVTKKGHSCLLSPAAPSYGFFKNFEDRGNQFESCVKSLN